MNEPKRLLDSRSGRLRALVEAGKGDHPDRQLQQKVLGALGLGAAGGAGLIAGAPDALARSGIARFFGGLRHAALSKAGIGVIAAATASSAGYLAVGVHERAREVATRSATSVAPAAAPVPLRSLAPEPSAASTPVTPSTTSMAVTPSTASADSRPSAAPAAAAHARGSDDASPAPEAQAAAAAPAIAVQLESIRHARALVAAGDARPALVELDAYETRYPHGIFEEEAMALRVRALRMAGDAAGAERERTNLQSRFPKSVHLAALGN